MGMSNPFFLIDFSEIHAISLPPSCLIFRLLFFFFLLRFLTSSFSFFLLFFFLAFDGSKWGRQYYVIILNHLLGFTHYRVSFYSNKVVSISFIVFHGREEFYSIFFLLFSSGFSLVVFPLLCSINRTIGHSKTSLFFPFFPTPPSSSFCDSFTLF